MGNLLVFGAIVFGAAWGIAKVRHIATPAKWAAKVTGIVVCGLIVIALVWLLLA